MNPQKLEHGFRRIGARIPILYLKGMRVLMFQLSGFYYNLAGKGPHLEPWAAFEGRSAVSSRQEHGGLGFRVESLEFRA